MNDVAEIDSHGVLVEPTTLMIQRHLPGPIERVLDYLTRSDLRRQWLAAGEMAMQVGATTELVWRNDELTDPPGERPPAADIEHRLEVRVTACDPPHRLAITWGSTGGVTFDLAPAGGRVLLTVTHHRVVDPAMRLSVSAGWHAHLDLLVARVSGVEPAPFWDAFVRIKQDYAQRQQA
ncbi:SRPBCC family protein [Roseomonas sp. CECT 9278]|uniref:SRPBCC family protein n=1 Tax=Roseomonas sp. CECT 9278 TaxID=2845823 RepID=UPI001E31B2A9|nr:SRPBCC family protein [Roseomonas sp. CECT 9278]CAH0150881.1 hypothetical protein ROS9278_00716 [Roseomonas sp. CECT 9278]